MNNRIARLVSILYNSTRLREALMGLTINDKVSVKRMKVAVAAMNAAVATVPVIAIVPVKK